MREILFRGWVREENRWIYGTVFCPRDIKNETYHTWRKAPCFSYGGISRTLFSRKKTSGDCIRYH